MAAAAGSSGSSVSPGDTAAAAGDGSGPVVSPFSKASVHRQVGETHKGVTTQKVGAAVMCAVLCCAMGAGA